MNTNEVTKSLSFCLETRGLPWKPADVNKALHSMGWLARGHRNSVGADKTQVRTFWKAGPSAGECLVEVPGDYEPAIRFCDSQFSAAWERIGQVVELMAAEEGWKARWQPHEAAAKAAEYCAKWAEKETEQAAREQTSGESQESF